MPLGFCLLKPDLIYQPPKHISLRNGIGKMNNYRIKKTVGGLLLVISSLSFVNDSYSYSR